jgi:3-deoxy-D-manno-octulosonic-acid transferase
VLRLTALAIYYLYNLLLILCSPVLLALLCVRLLRGKSRAGWGQRWGRLPEAMARRSAPRLWIHAASVGEVMAATPVIRAYHALHPDHQIVVSVVTPGGYEVAEKLVGEWITFVFYAPFDIPPVVRRVLLTVQPDVLAVMETELWPNLLFHARRSGAKLLLINGRISDRSFGRYRRFRAIFGWTLNLFDRLLAQTPQDAQRLQAIGAQPSRVEVFGNTKFDQATDRLDEAQIAALRKDLKLPLNAPVWVIGSTRIALEEAFLITVYLKLRETLPDLVLIHAPRHVERAEEVAEMMRNAGLKPVRRTQMSSVSGPVSQIVLDTFGELGNVYAVADVAYLGNSLIPPGGGQNPLQAFAQGKPAFYGRYMTNFRDIAAQAESAGVGFPVADADELAERMQALLQDRGRLSEIAERAVELVQRNRGAAARYAEAISEQMRASARLNG